MSIQNQIKDIEEISSLDKTPIALSIGKLGEEYGELWAAYLKHINAPNASRSAEDNTLEEGVDVLITILDVLFKLGHSEEKIACMMDRKCTKWVKKITLNQN